MPFLVFGTPPHSAATALTRAEKVPSKAQIEFDPGMSPAEAALLARRSEVPIVFGIRVEGEGFDNPDLSLPWGRDAGDRGGGSREPERDRGAGNRQPCHHAVA